MGFMTAMGGYTTHAVLNAQDAIRIPDALDFGSATALLVQGLTAYFLLEAGTPRSGGSASSFRVRRGEWVHSPCRSRNSKGRGKVIGLASPSKHERVRSLGADAVFDYTQSGWSKLVLEGNRGKRRGYLFPRFAGRSGGRGIRCTGSESHTGSSTADRQRAEASLEAEPCLGNGRQEREFPARL